MKNLNLAVAAILLFFGITAGAQEEKFLTFTREMSPEKVYLHTDREVYAAGDTIWFKGYVKNASDLSGYAPSNYIYVELISSMAEMDVVKGKVQLKERVRQRVKIQRRDDVFYGHFIIPGQINTGITVLRAYTYWMRNRELEYMFTKNIEIRNPVKDDMIKDLQEQKVRDDYRYTNLGSENPFAMKKKVVTSMDVQFLPESGRYFADETAVIGVKAVTSEGQGVKTSGGIFADGIQVSSFETNDLGMGKFSIVVPADTKKLVADVSAGTYTGRFNLPLPQQQGMVINLRTDTSGVTFDIHEKLIDTPLKRYVVLYDSDEVYFKSEYSPEKTHYVIPADKLQSGVNSVAVIDGNGGVYAERPFFIIPEKRVSGSFSTDKESYDKRERVVGRFKLKDVEGKPVEGDFSVSVTDDFLAPYSGNSYNIETYMYLGSELKGFVEKSQYYFDRNVPLKERVRDVDLLMMTQGWKYYDLPAILTGTLPEIEYGREYTQSISGKIVSYFGIKTKRSTVALVAPSIGFSRMIFLNDTCAFALSGLDFPDKTTFIIGAAGREGEPKPYSPWIKEEVFPETMKYDKYLHRTEYDLEYKKAVEPEFYSPEGELLFSIAPAFVEAEKEKQKNVTPYTWFKYKPGQYRSEKQLEPYNAYDLKSYIAQTCPGVRLDGEALVCRRSMTASHMSVGARWQPIIIYRDGMKGTLADLDGLCVSDIDAFAYFTGSDAYQFNEPDEDGMPLVPAVVVMFTTRWPDRTAPNVSVIKPLGWQKPISFYEVVYKNPEDTGAEPTRSTLYWNHKLFFLNGESAFRFYTSDRKGPYTVTIEGLTDGGEPVFLQEKIIRR